MTVFNGSQYLRTAIESILQQTYRDFHFLIIDDGSTDDTRDIVRSYDDERIELLCLDRNLGQTAALNIGVRHISTPWIARMDADDYSAPTRLEEQMRALEADHSLGCLGTFAWWFRDDPRTVDGMHSKPERHGDIKRALLLGSPIIHGSVMVSRKALLDVGGYNERYRYSADLELYDRLLARHLSANIPKPLIGLRRHHSQGSYSRIAIEEGIEIFSRRLASNNYCPADIAIIRRSLSVSYLQRARQLIVERKYFDLWRDLLAALWASPKTFLWHSLTVPVDYLTPPPIRKTFKRLFGKLVGPMRPPALPESADGTHQKGASGSGKSTISVSWEHLTEALYSVRRNCPLLPVLAIPWIHPKHPIHPLQEALMREEGVGRGSVANGGGIKEWMLWQIGRHILNIARFSLVLLQLRWRLRREITALKHQSFDLVAKTWSFGPEQLTSDRDFYYGDLQRKLENRGIRMLLLCGDAKSTDWKAFSRDHVQTSGLCKLPETCLLHPLTPFWLALKQVGASFLLHIKKLCEKDPLIRRVFGLASSECLSSFVNYSGLYFYIGKTAVRLWHPHAFLTLYEGHGWEKCAWWGVKVADPSCKTVGYQHAALHRNNLSLLRPQGDRRTHSIPDLVLCLGEKTRQMMQAGHMPYHSQLIAFGSFRRGKDDGLSLKPQPSKRTVLVIPEGLPEELRLIFDRAMEVARMLGDHHFIFRCHPVTPFAQVRRRLRYIPEDFPNIEISERQIEEDFKRSSVVLYRGSSAVFYAILYGLKPVFLHFDREHDVDPLFELSNWREYVSSPKDLELVLRRYAKTTEDCAAGEWQRAVDYVNAYSVPVDDASIDRFLEVVGLSRHTKAA